MVLSLTDIPGDNRLPEVSLLMTAGIILLERQTIGRPARASADQNWVLREFVILRKYGQNYKETRDIHRVNLQNRFYILRETRPNYGSLCIIY